MSYTIHQLAKAAGISVRALHYYDEIGLLRPSFVKPNGYRYYEDNELMTLQQILFFKELDFSLDDIKQILHAKDFDRQKALEEQKAMLLLKRKRIDNLITTINQTIQQTKGGEHMDTNDLYGSFTTEELEKLKDEARERWGHTDAYKQSVERTKHWTKADYDRIAKEGVDITQAIAAVMEKGANSKDVQEQIAKHYAYIAQFYDVSYEMYRNLGEMYVADPRFTAYYEKIHPGLAEFMKDAMAIYAAANEK